MTAKTQNTEATRKDGVIISTPVLQSEIIYKSTPTFAKATGGFAFSNDGSTNTLADGDVFLWISVEQVDNSTGASGADYVRTYTEGNFLLTFSDTIAQENVGDKVYVNNTSDDSVVTITSDTGNPEVCIGVIAEFVSANSAYVKIDGRVLGKVDSVVGDIVLEDNAVTAAKIAAGAVTEAKLGAAAAAKAKVKYEIAAVTVAAGQTAGTATVVAGGEIVGYYPTGNQDQFVDSIAIASTTLTVTLAAAATADNTFKVFVLKA